MPWSDVVYAVVLIAAILLGIDYFDRLAGRLTEGRWRSFAVAYVVFCLYLLCVTIIYLTIQFFSMISEL